MPKRIQRKRTKGWKMPPDTIYVGRPSVFGNTFGGSHWVDLATGDVVEEGSPNALPESLRAYREWVLSGIENRPSRTGHLSGALDATLGYPERSKLVAALPKLRGKDLACWCPLSDEQGNPIPCHADILLDILKEIANV